MTGTEPAAICASPGDDRHIPNLRWATRTRPNGSPWWNGNRRSLGEGAGLGPSHRIPLSVISPSSQAPTDREAGASRARS